MSQHLSGDPIAVPEDALRDFSWGKLFGDDRPVEVEIGTGKAGFLLDRARARPDLNFLGIEWANEFYRFAVDRMQRWRVPNVRILRTDAGRFIRDVCPRSSLVALHVYHPDPWPKRRHQKRRLFQVPFVDAAVACLVPGGRWAVQTDHAEYFGVIRPLLVHHPELVEVPFEDPEYGIVTAVAETNFEIKYRREARRIYRVAVRRRADVPAGDGSGPAVGGRIVTGGRTALPAGRAKRAGGGRDPAVGEADFAGRPRGT